MTWNQIPLADLLVRSEDVVDIVPTESYSEVTVRLWGRGVVLRGEVQGQEIGATRRFRVRAGQFILSRIDARNGALGIVPAALDGAVVSNDFPTYNVVQDRLLVPFLGWLSRTKHFVDLCLTASEGTTNRVRLKEDRFLATTIPLPPLSEQRRIVAKVEELAAKVDEARGLRFGSLPEIEALLHASRNALIGTCPTEDWIPLQSSIANIENGWSPACEPRRAEDSEWGVLKVGAVSFGSFDAKENKALPRTLQPKPEFEIKCGDFLMSRANTTQLVGACAVVRETPPHLLLCDKIFRFIFHQDSLIEPTFLDHVLKSPALREQIERGATGTSPTMKNISKAKILSLRIPRIGLPEQRRIVAYLDDLQSKVDSLKALQSQSAAELDALLPSILDKAFKGEL